MVLLISCVFPPEPVVSAQISADLAHSLSTRDFVTVVCPYPTRPKGTKFSNFARKGGFHGTTHVYSYTNPTAILIGRMVESLSFGIVSSRKVREQASEITVVYLNTWPLFAQYLVARTCRKYKIPLVLHVQDVYPETLTERLGIIGPLVKKLLMPIDKYVLKHSHSIVAIGNKMAKYLATSRNVDENKISIVYNWQDESRFNMPITTNRHNPKFTFMFLGSISPTANIEAVIEAYGRSESRDSKLIIAGSGSSRESCIKTASAYPEADISFIDAPSDQVPHILSSADVLILPLKKGAGRYSIPSKLAGYMFSSRPVLAFIDPDCDAADIISGSGCGWIVPSGNGQMLTDKMKEVQSIPAEKLLSLGKAGRDYAMKYLSKSANLQKLADIIKNSARQ